MGYSRPLKVSAALSGDIHDEVDYWQKALQSTRLRTENPLNALVREMLQRTACLTLDGWIGKRMTKPLSFLELVETHERRWGTRQYDGRPSLKDLMELPIVAVWACKSNFTFAVYRTAQEISQAITDVVTGKVSNPDNRRLVRIFVHQQPLDFTLQVIRATLPQESAEPAEPPLQPTASAEFTQTALSDVSRGATYRPEAISQLEPYAPTVVDVNPQRAPRIVQAWERRTILPGSYARNRQPKRARNQALPGRHQEPVHRLPKDKSRRNG